jgi:hypothetical protein
MPRKIAWLIILGLALSGCEWGWQRYTSPKYGFSILLPASWDKREGVLNTVVAARQVKGKELARFQPNLNVVVAELPQVMELPLYFDLNKQELLSHLGAIEETYEGDIFAGWLAGKWFSFQSKADNLPVKVTVGMWMKGKRAYTVTCVSLWEEAPKYDPVFKKVLQSLRVK